ncbi:hypothetical protein, partial [Staphylococcus capitis]|uniref:hypothetical protein n=1 Tax=Staphylococcus capitis TaxID=29388 RepID=UPI0030C5EF19
KSLYCYHRCRNVQLRVEIPSMHSSFLYLLSGLQSSLFNQEIKFTYMKSFIKIMVSIESYRRKL